MSEVNRFDVEAEVVGAVLQRRALLDDLPPGLADALKAPLWRTVFESAVRLAGELPASEPGFDSTLVALDAKLSEDDHVIVRQAQGGTVLGDVLAKAARLVEIRGAERLDKVLADGRRAIRDGAKVADVAAALSSAIGSEGIAPPMWDWWADTFARLLDKNSKLVKGGGGRVRTGFACVDAMLHIRPGNVVILAAPEKHGKTTFARQVGRNVARQRKFVLAHSREMSAEENVALDLADGLACPAARFFGEGDLSNEEWDALSPVHASLTADPEGKGFLATNAKYGTLDAICLASERFHRKNPLSLIIVDYLQLVEADAGRNASRENVVSKVSRGLKSLAGRLEVPVLALAQFNREYSKRRSEGGGPAPRPEVGDLRESGAISQDADAVCFIHNPNLHAADVEEQFKGPFEFIVARQRMGPVGSCDLWPDLKYARFRESPPREPVRFAAYSHHEVER